MNVPKQNPDINTLLLLNYVYTKLCTLPFWTQKNDNNDGI